LRILLESYLLTLAMGALDDELIDQLESIAHELELRATVSLSQCSECGTAWDARPDG
jgi:indole-3-glycerol phosphate synthase